jgi:general secretion pathway protein A
LRRPELRQLEQRITRRHRLQPLAPDEVRQYIERRLWVAHGGTDALLAHQAEPAGEADSEAPFWRVRFTPAAMRAVAAISGGLPRVVNVVCDRALEAAHRHRRRTVEAEDVRAAARSLGLPIPLWQQLRPYGAAAAMIAALVAAGLAAGLFAGTGGSAGEGRPDGTAHTAPATTVGSGLDGGTVPTPAPAAAGPASALPGPPLLLPEAESYTVIAASFRTEDRADALAAALVTGGLPAFTRLADGVWHQVVVGPYASQDEARQAQAQLEQRSVTGTQLVARPGRATLAAR